MKGGHPDYLQSIAARMESLNNRPSRRAAEAPSSSSAPGRRGAIPKILYTFEEVAEITGVSVRTVRGWRIPYFEEGGIRRIRPRDLEAFIAERVKKPDADSPDAGTLNPSPTGDN